MSDPRELADVAGGTIIRFEGVPKEESKPGEVGRFRRFLNWFNPWAKQSSMYVHELTIALTEAERDRRRGEADKEKALAEKIAAEAAKIDAERQQIVQETLTNVNQQIADIFSSDSPVEAKLLQLQNLAAMNPHLQELLDRIASKYEKLSREHGAKISIVDAQDRE